MADEKLSYQIFPSRLPGAERQAARNLVLWALAVAGSRGLERLSHFPSEGAAAAFAAHAHPEACRQLEASTPAPTLLSVRLQLQEYLNGERQRFEIPLAPQGTPFQKEVWAALLAIPFGETRSYLEVARALGNPGALRAVGQANHHNPIGIVIPCHRVIAADGTLGGYAGGAEMKRCLLHLEGARWAEGDQGRLF
jgi:methylated-DNA-[protein]-cysteine S-methyltransferase